MRIASRIFVVGAIPIAIAAGIAIAAILLLTQANRARSNAILAGTVFRTILTAVTVRNEYLQSPPEDRTQHATHFFRVAERAKTDLIRLRELDRRDGGETGSVSANPRHLRRQHAASGGRHRQQRRAGQQHGGARRLADRPDRPGAGPATRLERRHRDFAAGGRPEAPCGARRGGCGLCGAHGDRLDPVGGARSSARRGRRIRRTSPSACCCST